MGEIVAQLGGEFKSAILSLVSPTAPKHNIVPDEDRMKCPFWETDIEILRTKQYSRRRQRQAQKTCHSYFSDRSQGIRHAVRPLLSN